VQVLVDFAPSEIKRELDNGLLNGPQIKPEGNSRSRRQPGPGRRPARQPGFLSGRAAPAAIPIFRDSSMHHTNYIVREPLLDPKQRVIGYELCGSGAACRSPTPTSKRWSASSPNTSDEEHGWLLRDKLLFLDAVPAMLSTDALFALPPERTVLSLQARDLMDPDARAASRPLRAGGVGISLRAPT
jgi:hypothetical protein